MLEEAQEDAALMVGDLCHAYYAAPGVDWKGRKASTEALVDSCFALDESGGTIGPLPDGTLITVEMRADDHV